MSDKLTVGPRSNGRLLNQPPANQPWVWQSRALRQSDAWRSAGINARRFVDFLLIEHMKQGGRANGLLKATQRQLIAFGIGARYVTKAIREAEKLGLVDGYHGGRRVATKYALTWLPGTMGQRQRTDGRPIATPLSSLCRSQNRKGCPPKGRQGCAPKGRQTAPICLSKGATVLKVKGRSDG
jgi:hypothetical protein